MRSYFLFPKEAQWSFCAVYYSSSQFIISIKAPCLHLCDRGSLGRWILKLPCNSVKAVKLNLSEVWRVWGVFKLAVVSAAGGEQWIELQGCGGEHPALTSSDTLDCGHNREG